VIVCVAAKFFTSFEGFRQGRKAVYIPQMGEYGKAATKHMLFVETQFKSVLRF
jgi:hypothetical protein